MAARGGRLIVAWSACFALWLLLVDTVSAAELALGALAAALGALAAALVEREEGPRSVRAPDVLPLLRAALVRLPADLWLLARELMRRGRHRSGGFHRVQLAAVDAHRTPVELLGSLAPNTIVLGVDEDGFAVVHQLAAHAGERRTLGQAAR